MLSPPAHSMPLQPSHTRSEIVAGHALPERPHCLGQSYNSVSVRYAWPKMTIVVRRSALGVSGAGRTRAMPQHTAGVWILSRWPVHYNTKLRWSLRCLGRWYYNTQQEFIQSATAVVCTHPDLERFPTRSGLTTAVVCASMHLKSNPRRSGEGDPSICYTHSSRGTRENTQHKTTFPPAFLAHALMLARCFFSSKRCCQAATDRAKRCRANHLPVSRTTNQV